MLKLFLVITLLTIVSLVHTQSHSKFLRFEQESSRSSSDEENNNRNYKITFPDSKSIYSSASSLNKLHSKPSYISSTIRPKTTRYVSTTPRSKTIPGRNGRGKIKQNRRLCEIKHTEYMKTIFPNDEDIRIDANDTDFDGRALATPGEYPHMAALGFETQDQTIIDYKCGGSLISENFIITAAHCTNLTGQAPTKVRIGDLNLMVDEQSLEPQLFTIKQIFNHPQYKPNSYYNDIALLELDRDIEFTEFVRPIRLWTDPELPDTTVFAMGYGSTSFGKAPTNRLTHLNMTIVANSKCQTDMPAMPEAARGVIPSQICARDFAMNRDTCQGDSGGPLQLNLLGRRRSNRKHYHLVGITSFGLFCRSTYPSVYTRVSSFLDWIENIVWDA